MQKRPIPLSAYTYVGRQADTHTPDKGEMRLAKPTGHRSLLRSLLALLHQIRVFFVQS